MLKRKTKKLLVMLLTVAMAVTMIVPVSVSAGQTTQLVVSENQTFDNVQESWGAHGVWDIKNDYATVDNKKLESTVYNSTAVQIAEYWMKKETYNYDKIVVSFDVQADISSGGSILQVFAGDSDTEAYATNGTSLYNVYLSSSSGNLTLNNSVTVPTVLKNNATYNLEMTFDVANKSVTMRYKKDTDADYASKDYVVNFNDNTINAGQVLKKLMFWTPKLASSDKSYSVDNVVVSYVATSGEDDTDTEEMVVMENQTFDAAVGGGWNTPGKWDLKSAMKNSTDESKTPLSAVEGGKLVSNRWSNEAPVIIAEYNLKKESYGSKKIVVSFDIQANKVGGKPLEVFAGDPTNQGPAYSGNSIYLLNISDGYLYVNGWTNVVYTQIKDNAEYNLEITFDTEAETAVLRWKKSTDADYTTYEGTTSLKNPLGDNVIQRICFSSGELTEDDASLSIDNFKVSYKPEVKIEADLTVTDGEGTAITDLDNLEAGKRLTVAPVFKNTGSAKAKSAVFIVAWYGADHMLKDAFVEIDADGLAVGASNSDLGSITFTGDTEAGDYIKAFAWEGLTTLKPYNLVYAE